MTTTKAEFVDLAAELISDEFLDFGISSTVVKSTGWNDLVQSESRISSDSFLLIPIDNKSSQFDAQNIEIVDLVVIGEYQKITREGALFSFGVDNSHLVYGGINHSIIDTYIDPAFATIQMQIRPK